MGIFDLISKAASVAGPLLQGIFCFTFSNQSVVQRYMGTRGAITEGFVLYIAKEKQLISNLKISLRMTGVRPLIDAFYYQNDIDLSGLTNGTNVSGLEFTTPGSINGVRDYDPTYRQPTVNAMAIVKGTGDPNFPNPNYNVPVTQFQFAQLADTFIENDALSQANLVSDANVIIWAMYRQLAGVDTKAEVLGGFRDSEYPGPIVLQRGDYLQLILFGSNCFIVPEKGQAGVWGRIAGYISWEIAQDGEHYQDTLNQDDSIYKKFKQV